MTAHTPLARFARASDLAPADWRSDSGELPHPARPLPRYAPPVEAEDVEAWPDEATPGGYLAACRRRAGLSTAQAVRLLTPLPTEQRWTQLRLEALERNEPGDYGALVSALHRRGVLRFDLAHFTRLAAATCDADLPDDADPEYGW